MDGYIDDFVAPPAIHHPDGYPILQNDGYADGQRDAKDQAVRMFGPADRERLGDDYCNSYQAGVSDFLIAIGGSWNSDPRT